MKPAADAVLVLITVIWGVTFVVVKGALGHADPLTFLALRFTVGALTAIVIARRTLLDPALWRSAGVLGGFLLTGYLLQTFGLAYTSPSRSAFLTGLCVILVPFISGLLFRRRLAIAAVLGASIAVAGLYLLTGAGAAAGTLLGDLLTLGGAVAFAFHISLTERYAPKHPAFGLVAAQLAISALVFWALVPFGERRLESAPALWGAVVATGFLATTVCIGLQTWAQARTTAVRAALVYALEPVFAVAWSTAMTHEVLGQRELVGGGLIITGVIVGEVGTAISGRERARHDAA